MKRLDSISVDKTYYTDEGYLVDHPIVTTCGVFEYRRPDGSVQRELRLPEDVFDKKSLESYKGKPIIITHEAGEVDKENVRTEQIGTIMSAGYRDGDNVRCEIIIHDTNALKRCGLKELSLGYNLDTVYAPGVYNGEKYDCIQKNIDINHLAIVGEARAGEEARLNIDSKDEEILKGGKVMNYKPNFRTDDGTELTPEEMEAAIALFKAQQAANNANGEKTDGANPSDDTKSEPDKTPIEQVRANIDRRDSDSEGMSPEDIIAEQKADLDTLLSEIDKLQAENDMNGDDNSQTKAIDTPADNSNGITPENDKQKGVNMDSVDKMVHDRLDVYRMADKLNLDGFDGLSLKEGKKRIIKAVQPKLNLDGKSDAYIDSAYDIAKGIVDERKTTNDQRRRMTEEKMRKDAKEECNSVSARKHMIERLTGGNK